MPPPGVGELVADRADKMGQGGFYGIKTRDWLGEAQAGAKGAGRSNGVERFAFLPACLVEPTRQVEAETAGQGRAWLLQEQAGTGETQRPQAQTDPFGQTQGFHRQGG